MKIVKGKITEATEEELMEYYLRTDSDEIFPFKEYLERMIDAGVKIIEENENNMKGLEHYSKLWIEYNKQKPEIGQLVLVYRDIESKQIYSTVWSDEDEKFADWNEITHWMPLQYPSA